MSTKPQIELFLENESGTQQVAYPFVESDHVSLSNGMDIDTMIRQDVSMPTVTHEDLSFKAGVGDQDVSSAIVDSSVAEMTIKGKTYQNILPEPSTHVLTNNKEMFKVNEGLDPNAEIVDGVSKSAILSGNTLVNLVKKATINVESNQNDLWININKLYGGNLPKGKYILLYNIKKASSSTFRCTPRINLSDGTALYEGYENYNTTSGIKKWIFNATAEITDVYFWINTNTEPILVEDFILLEYQEGMENWDIPYFEGMKSVQMPALTTTGKNLFDINGNVNEKYDGLSASADPNIVDGNVIIPSSMSDWHHGKGQKIKVKKGGTYTCSFTTSDGGIVDVYGSNLQCCASNKTSTFTFTAPTDCDEVLITFATRGGARGGKIYNFQIEEGTVATSYEPYKSNILSTSEDVVLRGIGDVRDTLDLMTGEVTQRIKEIVLDGSENWAFNPSKLENTYDYYLTLKDKNLHNYKSTIPLITINDDKFGIVATGFSGVNIPIRIERSKLASSSVESFKQWLTQNPITVQYQIATPVVKTVDLSSSGNWEKVVLDGSESWSKRGDGDGSTTISFHTPVNGVTHTLLFAEGIERSQSSNDGIEGYGFESNQKNFFIELKRSRLTTVDVNGFKQYLQQNPITLWYQTEAHKDSTQVKQPIFFKDGHIQLSSGADNSLIPTLNYQAKTSNSYVMDLMKTNTRYTMKAKSASGTFTIDGTSYGAGTNDTFTTPSSMTNKFLVMSNKTNKEVMILEGDVTDKTIPYFKGIKSAFEDEDKIEVLSTGKNLFNPYSPFDTDYYGSEGKCLSCYYDHEKKLIVTEGISGQKNSQFPLLKFKPNTMYTFSGNVVGHQHRFCIHNESKQIEFNGTGFFSLTATTGSSGRLYVSVLKVGTPNGVYGIENLQIEESPTPTTYEPYKSNSTKIPLLSPLRSLPNGVCDELVIDRMKKKATLIQRIDKIVFDGKQKWLLWDNNPADVVSGYVYYDSNNMGYEPKSYGYTINDRLPHNSGGYMAIVEGARYTNFFTASLHKSRIGAVNVNDTTANSPMFQKWYTENPMTMYYELETPVITEVDLEGFPYIYKDGHIFLNGEITPVTEIKYSINQQHQIEASNQDLIRHKKEIDYLYELIGEYVRVDYKNTLLSLNLELK